MGENTQPSKEKNTTVEQLSSLNRRQLKELEEKEKTRAQKTLEAIVMLLPILCGAVALVEYLVIPNKSRNWKPWSYVWVLGIAIAAYIIFLLYATIKSRGGEKQFYEKLHYKAPRYSALFLFLALYDYLTLKTGVLTQPFVPCMNYIINAFLVDYKMLLDCISRTFNRDHLRLLEKSAVLGRPDHQVSGTDSDVDVDPDHYGGCQFSFRGRCVHHCSGLMVCGNRGISDRYFQCKKRLF